MEEKWSGEEVVSKFSEYIEKPYETPQVFEIQELLKKNSEFKTVVISFISLFLANGATISGKNLLNLLFPSINKELIVNDEILIQVYFPKEKNHIIFLETIGQTYEKNFKNFNREGIDSDRQRWFFGLEKIKFVFEINTLEESEGKDGFVLTNIPEQFFLHESLLLKNDNKGRPELFLHPNAQYNYDYSEKKKIPLLQVLKGYFEKKAFFTTYTLFIQDSTSNSKGQNSLSDTWKIKHLIRNNIRELSESYDKIYRLIDRRIFYEKLIPLFSLYVEIGWSTPGCNIRKFTFEKLREILKYSDSINSPCSICEKYIHTGGKDDIYIIGKLFYHFQCLLAENHLLYNNGSKSWKEVNFDFSSNSVSKNDKSLYSLNDQNIKLLGLHRKLSLQEKREKGKLRYLSPSYLSKEFKKALQTQVFDAQILHCNGAKIYGGFLTRYLSAQSGSEIDLVQKGDVDIHLPYRKYLSLRETCQQMENIADSTKYKFISKGRSGGSRIKGFTVKYSLKDTPDLILDVHPDDNHLNRNEKENELLFDAFPNVLCYQLGETGKERFSVFSKKSVTKDHELSYLETFILSLSSIYYKVYLLNEELPKKIYQNSIHGTRLLSKPIEMVNMGWKIDYSLVDKDFGNKEKKNRYYINDLSNPIVDQKLEDKKVHLDVFAVSLGQQCTTCEREFTKSDRNSEEIWDKYLKLKCGHVMCFKCIWFGSYAIKYFRNIDKTDKSEEEDDEKDYDEVPLQDPKFNHKFDHKFDHRKFLKGVWKWEDDGKIEKDYTRDLVTKCVQHCEKDGCKHHGSYEKMKKCGAVPAVFC